MRRPVVVTFLGTLACSGGSKAPPPTANPPPPEVEAPDPEPAPVVPPPGEHDRSRFTRVLNGEHTEHGRIFRRKDGTCYVHLPFEAGDGPPVSFRPPPQGPVDCPDFMTDASWEVCEGSVLTTAEGDACLCAVMGNPPPPPRPVDCPETEG